MTFTFEEDNVMNGDRMMWSLDGCNKAAPGTTEMTIMDKSVTMTFSTVFEQATLCMRFVGTRVWEEYDHQKMSVFSVYDVQPRVFSRGVPTVATVTGFGIHEANDDTLLYLGMTCDGSEMDRYSEVFGTTEETKTVLVLRAATDLKLCAAFKGYEVFYTFADITFLARGV